MVFNVAVSSVYRPGPLPTATTGIARVSTA
jgi:hypothetical protein